MIALPHISAWRVVVHPCTNQQQEDYYGCLPIFYKDSLQRVLLFALQPVLIFFRQLANRKFPVLLQLDLRYWLDCIPDEVLQEILQVARNNLHFQCHPHYRNQ